MRGNAPISASDTPHVYPHVYPPWALLPARITHGPWACHPRHRLGPPCLPTSRWAPHSGKGEGTSADRPAEEDRAPLSGQACDPTSSAPARSTRAPSHGDRGPHIRSGAEIPNKLRPSARVRAVSSQSTSRLLRSSQDRAALVEEREGGGEPIEVGGQMVELKRLCHLLDHIAQPQELDGKRTLGWLRDDHRAGGVDDLAAATPEDGADAGMRVLQIRRRVAIE